MLRKIPADFAAAQSLLFMQTQRARRHDPRRANELSKQRMENRGIEGRKEREKEQKELT